MKNLREDPEIVRVDRMRGHHIQPRPEQMADIPALYATKNVEPIDKVIHLHYFTANCDWWIAEVDPEELVMFGFCCLGIPQDAEWGYVSMAELGLLALQGEVRQAELPAPATIINPGIVVERELLWTPRPFKNIDRAMSILFAKGWAS